MAFRWPRRPRIDTTRLTQAAIAWQENGQPRSLDYDDIYFSVEDAVAESRHVFLAGNGLPQRLSALDSDCFVIGECGFGFGLNFLLACELFSRIAPTSARLHYISCELHPVAKSDLQRFQDGLSASLQSIGACLLAAYPGPSRGQHRLNLACGHHKITLDLLFEEASAAFAGLCTPAPMVDAWFLDGFTPARNTDIWRLSLFRILAGLSRERATVASYTVAGDVRRSLAQAGFSVMKAPGFGRKREMLQGQLASPAPKSSKPVQPWAWPWPDKLLHPRHIGVIGAGLAGCATAHALANRGFTVTLIERLDDIAGDASGNPRGSVHFSPARQLTPDNRFRLSAFLFAVRHYQALAVTQAFGWDPSGLLQLAMSPAEIEHRQDLLDRQLYAEDFMLPASPHETARLGGVTGNHPGLWFPCAGSLSPPALCRAWIGSGNITLLARHVLTGMTHNGNNWQVTLESRGSSRRLEFDTLVFCTGAAVQDCLPSYPMTCNHGQTDTYALHVEQSMPAVILRHRGYAIPWKDGRRSMITIGGNTRPGRHEGSAGGDAWRQNLDLLMRFGPQLAEALENSLDSRSSRAGTRTSTSDYLPVAGPVEDRKASERLFAPYARNARKDPPTAPVYQPGLYINAGHGGSGLVTAPLVGEYLGALISGTPLPLPMDIIAAIHPLRFLVRDLKRQRRATLNG